jgi:recombination protein RecT
MTQLVPAQQRVSNMRELLGKMHGEIAKAAPKHMTADRIIRVAMTSMQQTPRLAECTPESFLGCLLTCTQRGLAPDSASQHAHLIPFKDRKKGITVCTLIFGYKGLMDLALRHPDVLSFHVPQVVYEKDEFEYQEGQEPKLFHKPAQQPDRGDIVAFYAVAKLASGDRPFVWMWLHEVKKVRDAVHEWQKKPWKTHFSAMGLKTVVLRLCKWLPATPDLQAAITLDEQAEAGVPQSIESVVIDGLSRAS